VAEGETGELVYTSLAGRGSCVLRYRTGDLVVGGVHLEACPHCGRTVPRLSSRLDRVSNMKNFQLSKVKGTLVNLSVIKEELEASPMVEEWQLVISKRGGDPFDVDELQLNVALSRDAQGRDPSEVTREIEETVFRVSEVRLNKVRLLPLDEVLDLLGMETQLKEKRIVDLRQSREGAPAAAQATQAGSTPGG
jgi:phenylacetate-coenzyme A ligase PaaK-like adenylate-forming protein